MESRNNTRRHPPKIWSYAQGAPDGGWRGFVSPGRSARRKARHGGGEKVGQPSVVKTPFAGSALTKNPPWLLGWKGPSLSSALTPLHFAGLIFSLGRAELRGFNLATNDLGTLSAPVNTLQGKILWLPLALQLG